MKSLLHFSSPSQVVPIPDKVATVLLNLVLKEQGDKDLKRPFEDRIYSLSSPEGRLINSMAATDPFKRLIALLKVKAPKARISVGCCVVAAALCENYEQLTMWAFTLAHLGSLFEWSQEPVMLRELCYHFPTGFPSLQSYEELWKLQKKQRPYTEAGTDMFLFLPKWETFDLLPRLDISRN